MRAATRAAPVLAVVALLLAAGAALSFDRSAPTSAEKIDRIDSSLRCPTCPATSIADSQAPLAANMRAEVRRQVAQGRSAEEILAWFEARYGTTVLLAPPTDGVSGLVWALPPIALLTGMVGWQVTRRRSRSATERPVAAQDPALAAGRAPVPGQGPAAGAPRSTGPVLAGAATVAAAVAVVLVVVGSPGRVGEPATATASSPARAEPTPQTITGRNGGADASADALGTLRSAAAQNPRRAELWLALGRTWEERGRLDNAADAYRRAVALRPHDPTPRFLLAFALAREDRSDRAEVLLRQVLEDRPDHPEALLLLGTLQRQDGDPGAAATLRKFLRAAPDHPAAPRVRSMLNTKAVP